MEDNLKRAPGATAAEGEANQPSASPSAQPKSYDRFARTSSESLPTTTKLPGAVSVRGPYSSNSNEATEENCGVATAADSDNISETAASTLESSSPSKPTQTADEETFTHYDNQDLIPSDTDPNLPVAREYSDLPMVSADLVPTPVDVYEVQIDSALQQQAVAMASPTKGNERNTRKCRFSLCVAVAIVIVVSLAIAIPVGITQRRKHEDNRGDNVVPEETSAAPTFSYPCYTSTLDLFTAQIELEVLPSPLILCPNTRIAIGIPKNPSAGDLNYTNGDYPIIPIRGNVTIQCGLDGRRENNCILENGLSQVLSQHENWHPTYGDVPSIEETDFFTLRGITFTGQTQASGAFGGIPVVLSQPGKSMRFENCAWQNLTATKRLMAVGRNYWMELIGIVTPDLSVELTISNCLFDNITYEEEFIVSFQQMFHIEDSLLRNVRLSALLTEGCGYHPHGCRNLLHCRVGGPNVCSISNICVENFEAAGAGPILISNDTIWSIHGANTWSGAVQASQFTNSTLPPDQSFCSLGVARMDDASGETYSCLEERVFEQVVAGACPSFDGGEGVV